MNKKVGILAIDDEQVILDSIERLCSLENWHVDKALDVRTALDKMSRKQYHLILCDIMMPETDGFQFLQKANEAQNKTPIIITSGFSTFENAVKSLYSGAIDFIAKPFTLEELLGVLKRGLKFHNILEAHDYDLLNPKPGAEPKYLLCPNNYMRLGYTTWIKDQHDGSFRVGICDIYQKTLGDISSVDLMEVDEEIFQGNTCSKAKTTDQWQHFIPSPISGRILSRNNEVLNNINLLKNTPYTDGWLYTVVPSNLEYESEFLYLRKEE